TQSDTSKQVHINGVLASHTSATSPYGLVTNVLTIGARPGNEFFNGSIDDLRIYKKALSASEITSLYNKNALAVSKNQIAQQNTFYVYNSTLHFKNTQDLSKVKSISVFNLLAQKVYNSNTVQNENPLPLKQGLYILKVTNKNNQITTKKFMIN
ncbi:MAG TPA: T9SS type A sorting domain-containing protein, partial [Mariniflexile sp.]|nr:T9SS type A sorting domain-containing protein [Mariniflexile sp.]